MPIFQIDKDSLVPLQNTTFARAGVLERADLQRLLRTSISIISPDTLVVAEEFGEWEDSRRRIDLLAVDKDANLVVIELKRTEDGGHMELQALRYAAMVSALSFEKTVEIFSEYLETNGKDGDAQELLLNFLGWDSPQENTFANAVRIVLASADFSRELTTSVLWLNQQGLDIRCVRLQPYQHQNSLLLDVQQLIPLPEAQEYQVRIRNKEIAERTARTQNRDLTKFDVTVGATTLQRLPKRRAIFQIVKYLCDNGVDPDSIAALFTWRSRSFRSAPGTLDASAMQQAITRQQQQDGVRPDPHRFFTEEDELIHAKGSTYAFSKMWGARTEEALECLVDSFKNHDVSYCVHED